MVLQTLNVLSCSGSLWCPTVDGTEDVYNGITAGSEYIHTGGGSNYICMVTEPRYHPGAGTGSGNVDYIYVWH